MEVRRPGGLPDGGLSPQAVEELLESLDLEKSSCCSGLSRVSHPSEAARPALPGGHVSVLAPQFHPYQSLGVASCRPQAREADVPRGSKLELPPLSG